MPDAITAIPHPFALLGARPPVGRIVVGGSGTGRHYHLVGFILDYLAQGKKVVVLGGSYRTLAETVGGQHAELRPRLEGASRTGTYYGFTPAKLPAYNLLTVYAFETAAPAVPWREELEALADPQTLAGGLLLIDNVRFVAARLPQLPDIVQAVVKAGGNVCLASKELQHMRNLLPLLPAPTLVMELSRLTTQASGPASPDNRDAQVG